MKWLLLILILGLIGLLSGCLPGLEGGGGFDVTKVVQNPVIMILLFIVFIYVDSVLASFGSVPVTIIYKVKII